MIKITDKSQCCGCHSCAQRCPKHCISMQMDEEGFLYPKVDTGTCNDCGLCEKACPVINPSADKYPFQVYAAKNKNEEICTKSSSGGVFSMLAEHIIRAGGVVFGARFNERWDVEHAYTETIEGIEQFRSSKYVQSRIGNAYCEAEKFLKEGRQVLFTGTPCQIAGLRKFLRKDYVNLLCVDVICHGTPSPGVWRDYMRSIISPRGRKNSVLSALYSPLSEGDALQIKGISFRDKRLGWKQFSFVLQFSQGDSRSEENSVSSSLITFTEPVYKNLWMRSMLHNFMLRPSCYDCPARKGSSGSDILLGDFWGINRCHPDFYSEKGVSLVLAYTDKGKSLIESLGIDLHDATYADALDCNINIEENEQKLDIRDKFFSDYQELRIKALSKYCRDLEPHPILEFGRKVVNKTLLILKLK